MLFLEGVVLCSKETELKKVKIRYGKEGMELILPDSAVVLEGKAIPAIADYEQAVFNALANPIGSGSLEDLIKAKRPKNIAITVSDITRPVPNKQFLPTMLEVLNGCGISDEQIVIIVGTGMHRSSSEEELDFFLGKDVLNRIEVVDHKADDETTLVKVSDEPKVYVCRRFVEADFRIVTGLIEPHFMAGFSGGRKGVCPALVDLRTVQRFHGFETLANPKAENGNLEGNPCHEIALNVAKIVGVDFLFNVAIGKDRRIAGIYCGDLEEAHFEGCRQVAEWTSAYIEEPFDLVITNGGGYPLDETFYQTVKGMCCAQPGLKRDSKLLVVSCCGEQLGSQNYTELMLGYENDWCKFLADIEARKDETALDQWEFQMQSRILKHIGQENLLFVSDGIPAEVQKRIAVTPISGQGDARERAQRVIDEYLAKNKDARIAVIPEGPYTMLSRQV